MIQKEIDVIETRKQLSEIIIRLNNIIFDKDSNHKLQLTYKYDLVCVYDTSKYTSEDRRSGSHIFIGAMKYEECLGFLEITELLLISNKILGTDLKLSWFYDEQCMILKNEDTILKNGGTSIDFKETLKYQLTNSIKITK